MMGCGGFSRRYHVPSLLADGALDLVAIFDPHANDAVRDLSAATGARLVSAPEELPDVDAALVTTPHTLHAAHVDYALMRGWHVLVDKPFVMRTSDARSLTARAEGRGKVDAVGFNRRLDPGCLRAREIVRAGGIGAVRLVQAVQLGYERAGWFLDPALGGGGAFTGRGTHMADILPWLIDRQPDAVSARTRPGPVGGIDRGGAIDLHYADLECRITCLDDGWHMWDEVRLFGEDGMIALQRPLDLATGWAMTWSSARGRLREERAADPATGAITRQFLDAVRGQGGVACRFADAVPSVAIVEAAFKSAAAGGAVLRL
jgi:predicted dehydrogenase